jgi:GNAT superfamily N-acetyltransferase
MHTSLVGAHIRPLQEQSLSEVTWVAVHMRKTLLEVLGQVQGEAMYTIAWLEGRVREHLAMRKTNEGEVLVAALAGGELIGHTMLRIEEESGMRIGLFATFYVRPEHRRRSIASQLIDAGEAWFNKRGLRIFATNTAPTNVKLHRLLQKHDYLLRPVNDDFVRLEKRLTMP